MSREMIPQSPSTLSSVPTNITDHVQLLSNVHTRLDAYQPKASDVQDNTIPILRSLVTFLPRDGIYNVCTDIIGCDSDDGLHILARHFLTVLLAPFKSRKHTPNITPSPRFGADGDIEEISSELAQSSRTDQAWIKAACLERDGNRCVITGIYDAIEAEENMDFTDEGLEGMDLDYTVACHIVPFSFGSFSEPGRWNASIIWDSLYRCFPSIRSRLNFSAEKINDPYNIITMISSLHTAFDRFRFTLKPTSEENVYRIIKYRGFPSSSRINIPEDGLVTLKSHNPKYRLPSPLLLGLHSSIAQILHASGMGAYLEQILRDAEQTRCLAANGSSDVEALLMVF